MKGRMHRYDGADLAPGDPFVEARVRRTSRTSNDVHAGLAIETSVFHRPELGADLKPDASGACLDRDEALIACVIPGGFPEFLFIGEVALVMYAPIAVVRLPREGFVVPRAFAIDGTGSEHHSGREIAQSLDPTVMRIDRPLPRCRIVGSHGGNQGKKGISGNSTSSLARSRTCATSCDHPCSNAELSHSSSQTVTRSVAIHPRMPKERGGGKRRPLRLHPLRELPAARAGEREHSRELTTTWKYERGLQPAEQNRRR